TMGSDRGKALQEFVNADSSRETISRFSERYGAVPEEPYLRSSRLVGTADITQEFPALVVQPPELCDDVRLSSVSTWQANQGVFRKLWADPSNAADFQLDEAWGGQLAFKKRRLVYTTRSLHAFLYLSLAVNRKRLRTCARDGCATPFFFARHGPQKYCSPECSHSARKASELRWWNQNRKPMRGAGKRGKK